MERSSTFLNKTSKHLQAKDTDRDTYNAKPADNQRVFVASPGLEPESEV